MNNTTSDMKNEVKLSPDVMSSITEIAIQEIEGVNLPKFFSTKKIFKNHSIETILKNNTVELTIPLIVDYGIIIPEITPIVQEKVKENIEIMTGVIVNKVHLLIVGVNSNNNTTL